MTKRIITIESIFEGMMGSQLFGGPNEYLLGIGIDPDVPQTNDPLDIKAGGSLRPVQYAQFSGAEIDSYPINEITTPQSDMTWSILWNGKVVAYQDTLTSATSYTIGQVAGNRAQGAWYYNNYIYISGTGTGFDDLSRIGPLNTLPYDARSAPFTVGQIVTGATSGATGVIISQSPSFSRSPSASQSPSASRSPSASVSPSASTSPSPSASPSAGFSFSSSLSPSASVSISPSSSLSPSTSASPSSSLSPSSSTSVSRSPSTSVSPSASASAGSGLTGTLVLGTISGMFLDNEVITDPGGGSATVNRTFASLITDGVWKDVTLSSNAGLGNWAYPHTLLNVPYLNHFGFAHTNGASYFLDFNAGKGYIHKIQTTKVTYQGDTDDGSAYGSVGALSLPWDYMPITAVSYSTDIVIAGTRTSDSTVNQGNAHLFFWDAAEELFYRIVPLPDPLCTVLKYVNGVLYGLSGDVNNSYRLWRYVGGDAIETLKIIEDGSLPLQYAADFVGNRLVWAANTTLPTIVSGLYAYGSKSDLFPRGLHHIAISGFT